MLSEFLWCSVLSRFGWVVRLVTAPNISRKNHFSRASSQILRVFRTVFVIFAWLFHTTLFRDRSICKVSSNSLLK